MPFDTEIQLDPNKRGYGLPKDCCVGDGGPTPEEVTTISKGTGRGPVSGYKDVKVPVGYDGPEGL